MSDPTTTSAPAAGSQPEPAATPRRVQASAGTYYRTARYIMCVVLVAYGAWSIFDGFHRYPHDNNNPWYPYKKHTTTDIWFNRVLGVALPPLGLFIAIRAIVKSRGRFVLEDGVLRAPGRPPIPLSKITSLDSSRWDRKGIAVVHFDLVGPGAPNLPPAKLRGEFVLDDFVYAREGIDAIYTAIDQSLAQAAQNREAQAKARAAAALPSRPGSRPQSRSGLPPAPPPARTPPRPRQA